jgi:ribosomal protein L18
MKKLLTTMLFALSAAVLSSCGGDQVGLSGTAETLLICKAPETLTEDGTACELVIVPCNYPEIPNELGLCVMDTGAWPDGTNGITMPEPEYIPQAGEVVLYYALKETEYTGWGLHAFNEGLCTSWAMFDGPGGETTGTSWGIPIDPVGVDPNFGVYWVMDLTDNPNCGNWIPYNFDASLQVQFTAIADVTGNPESQSFFLLEGLDLVFPNPRTFDSLVVPGGSTLICEDPQVLNEAGDACIDDPTVLETFIPDETTLYLKGSFNDWTTNEEYVFEYADGVYTMVASIAASADEYSFKIADDLWSEPTSFGAAATEEPVVLGEGKNLVVGENIGQNITLTVSEDTNYQFIFDATDPELPVLTVIEVPLKRVMYVKGTLNEWSNSQAMVYEGDNLYSSIFSLDATDYEFKVADANWTDDTNFGATLGDEVLELDMTKSLVFGEGVAQNITLTIANAGNYKFTLDATDPGAPVLTVSNAAPYGTTQMYVKGTMNEWSNQQAMVYLGDNIYRSVYALDVTSYEFKVADADWTEATNFGAATGEEALELAVAKSLVFGEGIAQNMILDITVAGDYAFTLNATDPSAPIITITEVLPPYGDTAMYVKGTMNEWSNAQEMVYEGKSIYSSEYVLDVTSYEFKVADADWTDATNFGAAAGDEALVLDMAKNLVFGEGIAQNITLDITTAGTYKFSLDGTNPIAPVLTVVLVP